MSEKRSQLGWIVAAIVLGGIVPSAAAETYPTRPIRLVVGFLAGGPTDVPARFIADRLSSQLGQKVFVEDKPGAGGMIALNDVSLWWYQQSRNKKSVTINLKSPPGGES